MKIVPKIEQAVNHMMKAEPPRTMSREDRRIVFEKLNGVYLDEKRGYDTGWSDHKVAIDLGVPRAWVEQVREEMFGPVNSNPEIQEFLEGVKALKAIRDQVTRIDTISAEIKALNPASLTERIAKLEKLEALVRKSIPG